MGASSIPGGFASPPSCGNLSDQVGGVSLGADFGEGGSHLSAGAPPFPLNPLGQEWKAFIQGIQWANMVSGFAEDLVLAECGAQGSVEARV